MIERLELENFTGFKSLGIDFSPKVNVIIGENGTGKTHLLKAAYSLCFGAALPTDNPELSNDELGKTLTDKLLRLFMPLEDKLGKMHRLGAAEQAKLSVQFAHGQTIAATFFNNSKTVSAQGGDSPMKAPSQALFIPTKEVLSLVKGIYDESHDQKTVELIFDDGYLDLARLLMQTGDGDVEAKINLDPRLNAIIPQLVDLIGGRYWLEDGGFCFQPGRYVEKQIPGRSRSSTARIYQDNTVTEFIPTKGQSYSSGMTAEGFRKIGILHRLLSNGALSPGTSGPLFWDEPESNMNPKLMKLLVQVILELSRNGQQVILATHDYVLLKWFDLLMDKGKGDHVRFHILRCNGDDSIRLESVDDYRSIPDNAISNTFSTLYDEEIKRALGDS